MSWLRLKGLLENHNFEIEKTGQGKRDWVFRSNPDDPIADIDFVTLGAGTNKIAVRIANEPWVLLFGKTGRDVENKSFQEEVDTLLALGGRGLRVPRPHDGGGQAAYIFKITVWNDGEEPKVSAFLQEFMSRDQFVEMTKTTPRERDEFAKAHIVTGGRVPATIDTTIADLKKIKAELAAKPWGDFQVMYEKSTGRVIVFDPLPSDPNAKAYRASVDAWLKDIEVAMEISNKLQKTVQDLQAQNKPGDKLLRRYSLS